jgi:hypothetical protein
LVAAPNFSITSPDEPVHITAFIGNDVNDADSRE